MRGLAQTSRGAARFCFSKRARLAILRQRRDRLSYPNSARWISLRSFIAPHPHSVLTIGVNIAPMPAPTLPARQTAPASPKRAKLSGEFVTPSPKRRKLLEKVLTPEKSVTSQFLIDKNLPILTISAPGASFCLSPPTAISNRNSEKLKSSVSYRKQSIGQCLIATFRALFSPEQAHFKPRFATK